MSSTKRSTSAARLAQAAPKRFSYAALNADQFRIALELLNIPPAEVERTLDEAAQIAVESAAQEALGAFGYHATAPSPSPANPATANAAPREVPAPRATKRPQNAKNSNPAGGPRVGRSAGRGPRADGQNAGAESKQLQGRYIAAIRRVPKTRRKEFKALVEGPGGRAAAIDAIDRAYPKQL
jgi:hypothetical protein